MKNLLGMSKTSFALALSVTAVFLSLLSQGTFAWVQQSNAHLLASNRELSAQGVRALQGLCALRGDVVRRLGDNKNTQQQTRDFLRTHPNGIPGIPASLIRQGIKTRAATIRGQESTIRALSGIGCSTPS